MLEAHSRDAKGSWAVELILRRARREDAEAVATFNARVHHSPQAGLSSSESPTGDSRWSRAT